MKSPTITRAADVACAGTIEKIGNKNSDNKKKKAHDKDVSPVLPPSATPDADSTKVVTVDVPRRAPTTVPIASDKRARPTPGRFPSLSIKSAFVATPVKVPTVSNKSTNKNVNITENMSKVNKSPQWSLKATGASDGGSEKIIPPGKLLTPKISARTVPVTIPYKRAPLTFFAVRSAITISDTINTTDGLDAISPRAIKVASLATITPADVSPTRVIKSPIPTETAFFSDIGIDVNIASRILKKLITIKIRPSKNTAVSA